MEAYLSEKVLMALRFAALAHQEQKRKDDTETPYISHPVAAGMILAKADFAEDVICAGILHDVIEDTAFSAADIEETFGVAVASLVQWVTEDKDLEYFDRKEAYLQQLEQAPAEAKAVSAADLLANRYDMLVVAHQGEDIWAKFPRGPEQTLAYDRRRIAIIKQDVGGQLVEELEEVLGELEKLFL